MNLYEIQRRQEELEQELIELGGELTEEMEKALVINREELEKKGKGYIYVLQKLQEAINTQDELKKRAENKKKSLENAQARLKQSLLDAQKQFGDFEAGDYTITTRKSQGVEIPDHSEIPSEYMVVSMRPDRAKIKADLKEGKEVKGAKLVENKNLRIK